MKESQGREETPPTPPPDTAPVETAGPAAEVAEGGSCGYRWQKGDQPGPRLHGDKCTTQRGQMDGPAFGIEVSQGNTGLLFMPWIVAGSLSPQPSQRINLTCQGSWLP